MAQHCNIVISLLNVMPFIYWTSHHLRFFWNLRDLPSEQCLLVGRALALPGQQHNNASSGYPLHVVTSTHGEAGSMKGAGWGRKREEKLSHDDLAACSRSYKKFWCDIIRLKSDPTHQTLTRPVTNPIRNERSCPATGRQPLSAFVSEPALSRSVPPRVPLPLEQDHSPHPTLLLSRHCWVHGTSRRAA